MSLILTEVNEGIAQLTLNNPPLNVITVELTRLLSGRLDELAANPMVQVLVLEV